MSVRRIVASLGLVLAASACSENFSSPAAMDSAPHFLKWAPATQPEFAFEGANAVGSRFGRILAPTPAAVVAASHAFGDVETLTWSHNSGTGSNRLLVVSVSLLSPSKPVATVTYQGATLTFFGARNNADNTARVEFWYLVAPPTGAGNVVVRRTDDDKMIAGAVTLTGVNQTTPLGAFVSAASNGSTTPSVGRTSAVGDLVVDAIATKGGTVKGVGAGQTHRWNANYEADFDGAVSTEPGAAAVIMSSTLSESSKWVIGTVSVKPAPSIALSQYQATFWAKRGTARTLQINYAANGGTSPFMKLTISDPTYVPGRGNIAMGDSVLVTATVDPNALTISLEPHQMQFGTASQLQIWYSGAGGDLNGDGVVNSADATIENQLLGLWYQADPTSSWAPIPATQSLSTKSFTAALQHFSGYAVSW